MYIDYCTNQADLALTNLMKPRRLKISIKRLAMLEAIAWEEAQQTDEVWWGLPTLPSCGTSVKSYWSTARYVIST